MFIWLASYPKSGNTLIRSMLVSYFFSNDGIFNFNLIKNIKQFPKTDLFEKNGVNIYDEKEVIKNYIKVQEQINEKNSTQFLKTHSYLFNIENNPFTNLEHTLGVIYIVRDPRSIVISSSNHNNCTHQETTDQIIEGSPIRGASKSSVFAYPGTWSGNYNSWKSFKSIQKYLLIKYEDLIIDKEKIFFSILKFIYKLKKIDFVLDKNKFQNSLESTNFNKLQNLEKKEGFEESAIDKTSGKKRKFFYLGPKNDWAKMLDKRLSTRIENAFQKEMIELGYI
jgi:hypothetical protein